MDDAIRMKLVARLREERERLASELADQEADGRENVSDASGENNYRDHMADQGTATFSRELDMSLEDNVRDMLSQVEHALVRVDEGLYGVCTRCGADITADRLEAMPEAELCISCKELEEVRG